ncbi:phosphoglycolate phosphatase [Klenkia marina]|uniref:Phosphoglycolate phosphatase n=1 Tax=Klenkia marina TaxID=1960309 RepID=A0A1G4XEG2_9ACTN|nr:HAD hydrolase-like protein [Klenkia marina]SCX39612.1 phosphoglycolate phosphatase [Klenkia marina]
MPLTLFDLDGTLVDSAPGIHASVRVAAARLGLPEPTSDQLTAMVGPPLQDGFATVLGLDLPDVDRAVAAYRAHYAAGAMFDAPLYPGVPELLAQLRSEGQLLAVATSKPVEFARRILDHVGLGEAFDSVHGATLDGRVRHKQQVVARALAEHPDGAQPVLVGDRAQDVVGARVHGLPCVGAGWGPARPGELAQAGAAVVVATPAEVPAALVALRT